MYTSTNASDTNFQYQLVSLTSQDIVNLSKRPVNSGNLFTEDQQVCSICSQHQNYCLGHNKHIQLLQEYVPKPFLIPVLEQFLQYLDPQFNISHEKQETFKVLHFEKVNKNIFVAVMMEKDVLLNMLYYIMTNGLKKLHHQPPSNLFYGNLYCVNNGVIKVFIDKWCQRQSSLGKETDPRFPHHVLQTIFINAIPITSIVDRVYQLQASNTYKNVYKSITTYQDLPETEKLHFQDVLIELDNKQIRFGNVFLLKQVFQDIDYSSKRRNKELLESLQKQEFLQTDDINNTQYMYNKLKSESAKLAPEVQNYLKFITGVFVAMSKETSKNAIVEPKNKMLQLLGLQQNTQDPYSVFSACINKEGYFRQAVNSCRINKSSRTVCTGNPLIHSWQCVCPLFIAKNIYVPVNVNQQNIIALRNMILNYPNYPCVCQIKQTGTNININYVRTVSENNFRRFAQDLKNGDIVYRQIINNDICLTNRFPSIREESFGSHSVIVDPNTKSLQFNLQVVKKMNADFDGDELQLYFLACQSDCTETAMLSSMPRQLITYETGKSLIGGCKELDFMIYNIQNDQQNTSIINQSIQKYFGKLNFKSDGIEIKDGKIRNISKKICSGGSTFIATLSHYFPAARVIALMDNIIKKGYGINRLYGQTIYSNLFKKFNFSEYQAQQLINLQQILSQIDGFTNLMYIEQQYTNELNRNIADQLDLLKQTIKTKMPYYYNNLIDEFVDQIRQAKLQLGQVYNEHNSRLVSKYRTLPLFKKFQHTPKGQGFIDTNYIDGVDALGLFYDTIPGRLQIYKKGNTISKDGYNTRCVSKGMENVFMGYNNIIYGDDKNIISLDYLYDSRRYFLAKMSIKQIKEQLQKLSFLDKITKQQILNYLIQMTQKANSIDILSQQLELSDQNQTVTFVLPFELQQQTVTINDLNKIISSRITSQMSDILVDNLVYQSYTFYLYCLLNNKVVEQQQDIKIKNITDRTDYKHKDIQYLYLTSLCPAGDPVGLKAGMGLTEPNSQETLNSIHSGKTEFKQIVLEKSIGQDRFSELATGKKGPIIVYFKLFNVYDKKEFIRRYQRVSLKQLQTKYDLYIQDNKIYLDINIPIKALGYYNVDFGRLIQTIQTNKRLVIFDVQLVTLQSNQSNNSSGNNSSDDSSSSSSSSGNSEESSEGGNQNNNSNNNPQSGSPSGQIVVITLTTKVKDNSQLLLQKFMNDNMMVGNQYIYNITLDKKTDYIAANITPEKYNYLFNIKEINPDTIYINDPNEIQKISGIISTKQYVYLELYHNLSTIDATKEVQPTHVKLLSDVMCYNAQYQTLTRINYKKQLYKDVINLSLFEQCDMFIINSLLHTRPYNCDTFLSSVLFGTQSNSGTNVSQISIYPKK